MQTLKRLKWLSPVAAACMGVVAQAQTPTLTPSPSGSAPSTTRPAGSSSGANPTHSSTSVPDTGTAAQTTPRTQPAATQTPGASTDSQLPNTGMTPPASPSSSVPSAPGIQLAAPVPTTANGAPNSTGLPSGVGQAANGNVVTLADAIKRAESSDVTYATAVSDAKVAQAQRGIALATILPTAVYHNQFIYTQPLRVADPATLSEAPRFISNNSVHEYVSQGLVTETIGAASITDFRKSYYDSAAAKARLEVARRGLVNSVITNYYTALAANEKLLALQRALGEAQHFATVSKQLEAGGEVARADTVKSNLQVQQRQRDFGDAQLIAEKTRLDLGVLLFADPLTTYSLSGDLATLPPLPMRDQIQAAANVNNPDLKAAVASFHAASLELTSAHFDYLPSLSVQFSYGIDASQFAATSSDGSRNLGYAGVATLDIPIFDWFATRDRGRQSAARKVLAQVTLTNTQRKLVASIENLYREAEVAQQQTTSLENSVRDAMESLRLTDLRYSSGEATILEVVDAQNTLITVQSARADGAARYYTALANLQTLTGNLP